MRPGGAPQFMAITAAMSGHHRSSADDKDGHEHDVVMPGFRFHPTEEELVEFYLRRKVEGKPFNVELITFLDLYRYDPWELPALAAIGEKEWFFYVPRDRKYRNGDRPNRVTTSGYWKATGADRMIKTESSRSIGLKKTLVFYSGKAPKGVRTSWIMNEYRLPQNETDRYQKAEISLCRVYKRAGVEDHHLLSGNLSSRPSSSRGTGSSKKQAMNRQPTSATTFQSPRGDHSSSEMENMQEAGGGMAAQDVAAVPSLPDHAAYGATVPMAALSSATPEEDAAAPLHVHSKDMNSLVSACTLLSSSSSSLPAATVEELNRIVGYHQSYAAQPSHLFPPPSPSQLPSLTSLPSSLATFTDRLWEWNPIPEAERDYTSFK